MVKIAKPYILFCLFYFALGYQFFAMGYNTRLSVFIFAL